jgi:PD-(D/E)XK nuclease superfamily protein
MTRVAALPIKQFTSWSYSRYHDYTECPLRASLKHLHKLRTPEMIQKELDAKQPGAPENPLQRGERIAKEAAQFLTKKVKKVPMDLMSVAKEYRELVKAGNLSVEQSWGFTKDWKPCSPTDWNNCWMRVQIDVCHIEEVKKHGDILHITDNKSGRFDDRKNEEYQQQLELYGAAGLARMPTVIEATARLLYSDLGMSFPTGHPMRWRVDELPTLKATWNKRVKPMFNDTRFAPRPGPQCRYCDFAKARNGPCMY